MNKNLSVCNIAKVQISNGDIINYWFINTFLKEFVKKSFALNYIVACKHISLLSIANLIFVNEIIVIIK